MVNEEEIELEIGSCENSTFMYERRDNVDLEDQLYRLDEDKGKEKC